MDSILTTIKKLLGITEEYTHFDPDIVIHINTVFMVLMQLGVGPSEGFAINDDSETWDDFKIDTSVMKIEWIKTYIYLKVRLIFDPPASNALIEAINRSISELEWRLNVAVTGSQSI